MLAYDWIVVAALACYGLGIALLLLDIREDEELDGANGGEV